MKKIFFDLDGTLIDISEKYFRVYSDFMRSVRVPAFSKKDFWRMMRRNEKREVVVKKKSLAGRYRRFFLDNIEREKNLKFDTLFRFAIPVLRRLREGGARMFLITMRRDRSQLFRELKRLGLMEGYFERLMVIRPRPGSETNFEAKRRAMKRLVSAGDILVGDSRADILAGRKMGLTTVGVLSGIRNYSYLKALSPDLIVRDIRSLVNMRGKKALW